MLIKNFSLVPNVTFIEVLLLVSVFECVLLQTVQIEQKDGNSIQSG